MKIYAPFTMFVVCCSLHHISCNSFMFMFLFVQRTSYQKCKKFNFDYLFSSSISFLILLISNSSFSFAERSFVLFIFGDQYTFEKSQASLRKSLDLGEDVKSQQGAKICTLFHGYCFWIGVIKLSLTLGVFYFEETNF